MIDKEDLKLFGVVIDDQADEWVFEDLVYDLAKKLVKNHELVTQFKKVADEVEGYSYHQIQRWIFQHENSERYFAVQASLDSWIDDGAFGEEFDFFEVFPKKIYTTKYVTKDELEDSWGN